MNRKSAVIGSFGGALASSGIMITSSFFIGGAVIIAYNIAILSAILLAVTPMLVENED